jgi:hypothetical protein
MTGVEQHVAAMNAANSLTETAGVKQKGGKRYLEVKHRVSILRQTYGLELGIDTELLHADEKYVRVAAKITDAAGRVIGSGLAEEVRGSSGVTTTSAIEVCETSAIGRAASSVGLHGGEYASLNEIEVARSHDAATQPPAPPPMPPIPPPPPQPQPMQTKVVAADIPFDDTDAKEVQDWSAWCASASGDFSGYDSEARLRGWMNDNKFNLEKLQAEEPAMYKRLGSRWSECIEFVKKGART